MGEKYILLLFDFSVPFIENYIKFIPSIKTKIRREFKTRVIFEDEINLSDDNFKILLAQADGIFFIGKIEDYDFKLFHISGPELHYKIKFSEIEYDLICQGGTPPFKINPIKAKMLINVKNFIDDPNLNEIKEFFRKELPTYSIMFSDIPNFDEISKAYGLSPHNLYLLENNTVGLLNITGDLVTKNTYSKKEETDNFERRLTVNVKLTKIDIDEDDDAAKLVERILESIGYSDVKLSLYQFDGTTRSIIIPKTTIEQTIVDRVTVAIKSTEYSLEMYNKIVNEIKSFFGHSNIGYVPNDYKNTKYFVDKIECIDKYYLFDRDTKKPILELDI